MIPDTQSWPELTIILMVAFFVIVVGVDVILLLNKKQGDTYSEVIRAAGKKWIAVIMMTTFGMGLLAGHWFW